MYITNTWTCLNCAAINAGRIERCYRCAKERPVIQAHTAPTIWSRRRHRMELEQLRMENPSLKSQNQMLRADNEKLRADLVRAEALIADLNREVSRLDIQLCTTREMWALWRDIYHRQISTPPEAIT